MGALWVLFLNLFLGMIIFGALMYSAEQGVWDSDTEAYLRDKVERCIKVPLPPYQHAFGGPSLLQLQ